MDGGLNMVYLLIGIAGALGALTRYLIGLLLFSSIFPFATLVVNLIGCYVLAFLSSVVFQKSKLSSTMKTAITTGFLGGFTTFSTFSIETVELFQQGNYISAVLYVSISILGGIVMTNLGWKKE